METPECLTSSQTQNVLTQDPAEKDELNSCLEAVADRFGLRWLEQGDRNPVPSLWQAKQARSCDQ
ncbi:hypothetical protein AB7M47_008397 [Bradyrhizobium elkanii]|jgi:hypothetical protein|uniref:Uncharacterized protein n=1 Tax=Bradyrhizobium elkanii TaxID=29448 RepID=A0A8I2BWY8_BRAEL|nr:hypothetical protein [Bradyrhizobium elkanii]MBP2428978.1 hypothetical protein [Bradyrhizobium elkanii]MCP1972187.1 hypothetical protein [Bradyrhizobium elkanii]MCS3452449.1 hypothetical protein [Bradyrhizobium elkanii]MCS3565448.1 hypothetical protein [Bradyrhizobium elkanii]